jgi:hypothetical protein
MRNIKFLKVKDKVNEGQETLMNTGLFAIGSYCIVALGTPHYINILKKSNRRKNV